MAHLVFANSRSVCTKGTQDVATSTAPDACITPDNKVVTPDNSIGTEHLGSGETESVMIDGHSVWTRDGRLDACPSDPGHEGTQGGVVSGAYRDYCTPTSYSPDVFFEGGPCVRRGDTTQQNKGNTQGIVSGDEQIGADGRPKGRPWTLECVLKIFCKGDAEDRAIVTKLANLETVHKRSPKFVVYKKYDGRKWETLKSKSLGSARGKTIEINDDLTCVEAASAIFHEVFHTEQTTVGAHAREREANIEEEKWRRKRRYPARDQAIRSQLIKQEREARKAAKRGAPPPPPPSNAQVGASVTQRYDHLQPEPTQGQAPPPRVLGMMPDQVHVRLDRKDPTTGQKFRLPKPGDRYRAPKEGGELHQDPIPPADFNCDAFPPKKKKKKKK